jgi:hypothetical protein
MSIKDLADYQEHICDIEFKKYDSAMIKYAQNILIKEGGLEMTGKECSTCEYEKVAPTDIGDPNSTICDSCLSPEIIIGSISQKKQ